MLYKFENCELDDRRYELRRAGELCHVEPQVFNVLLFLLRNRDRVVGKEELLVEVWGDTFVTEATLNSRIMAARKAIGDDGSAQRLIKTLRGRGFRFSGEVDEQDAEAPKPEIPAAIVETAPQLLSEPLFGRADEMRHLLQRTSSVLAGQRQMVFVTGEAGLGKTTFVNAFLAKVCGEHNFWLLHGQCLDQRGAGEAYMPLLEALGKLCRESNNETIVQRLRQCAPTWLVQLPWLVTGEEWELLERRVLGATRDRMLREMLEMLDSLAAERPLLIVLEDLHWCDHSTLDLLSALARRQGAARILVIGTYRPGDVQANGHPMRAMMQDLRIRGYCSELALSFLSEAATDELLQARFTGLKQVEAIAKLVQQRTNGNPLFIHLMINSWLDRGWLACSEGHWTLGVGLDELTAEVPETLRHLIENQIEGLSTEEQQLLEGASVAGVEFAVAALVEDIYGAEQVEHGCAELVKQGKFLAAGEALVWPDGTFTERFLFPHHLYQEVLYERIPASRRSRLHRQIGDRLEAGYAGQTSQVAAELAAHFTRGRDNERAIRYSQQAAQQALRRSACREAIGHLRQALELLKGQPDSPERMLREIELLGKLASSLIVLEGWVIPELEATYERMRVLSEQLDEPNIIAATIGGLATMHEVRGEYERAQGLIEEQLQIIQRAVTQQHDSLLVQSHELLACSFFHQGKFEVAQQHADEGLRHYKLDWFDEMLAILGEDMGVCCHCWSAHSQWFAGYPDAALERMQHAIKLAQTAGHRYSLASVMSHASMLHQLRGEIEQVENYACESLKLAEESGVVYRMATGSMMLGWTQAVRGEHEAGIERIREGLKICQLVGAFFNYPYFLTLLAQACGWAGRFDEGFESLDEATITMRKSQRFFYVGEMHRLRGELHLKTGLPSAQTEAELCFERALGVAREMKSKSLELRVANDLCQLWQGRGQYSRGRELLLPIFESFTEGFELPDLGRARQLLDG